MARRRRKARATALWGQGLPQQNHRIACPIQQPLRGAQPQRADTRVEGGRITLYGYDSRNRLNEVRDGSNSNLIARYGYDPQNRRLWKEQYRDRDGTALTQAKRTDYLSADEGLITEATQDIVLNADETVTANGSPAIVTQYGPRPDNPNLTATLFIKTRNSNNLDIFAYYHHDHLGTPVQATDKQGNVVWAANYHAFGMASIVTPAATPDIPTITSNLRLPGQYADEETGLYYNLNRYYDPVIGGYLESDPIGLKGGINTYAYVRGNPLSFVDPLGLDASCGCSNSSSSYFENVRNNFINTNSVLTGNSLLPTGVGLATASVTARSIGSITFLQTLGFYGTGNFGGAVFFASITAVVNTAAVGGAFQSGILVGSMINSIPTGQCGQTLGSSISGLF